MMKITGRGTVGRQAAPGFQKGNMKKKSWFTIQKIHPRVFALAEFFHWEKAISYLVIGKNAAVLFDTGMGYANIYQTVRAITSLPITVLLTHAHWDHIGGISSFDKVYLYSHQFETNLLVNGFTSKDILELSSARYFKKPFAPRAFSVVSKSPIFPLTDGQVITCGGYKITVLHTPGHTPGSVCYWIKELNIVFVGDTLYPGALYAHLPESNLKNYKTSLDKLVQLTDEKTIFFPGHNAMISNKKFLLAVQEAFKTVINAPSSGKRNKGVKENKFTEFSILSRAW